MALASKEGSRVTEGEEGLKKSPTVFIVGGTGTPKMKYLNLLSVLRSNLHPHTARIFYQCKALSDKKVIDKVEYIQSEMTEKMRNQQVF